MTTPPSADALKLTAEQLNAFLRRAFSVEDEDMLTRVVEVRPGYARVARRFHPGTLRPGGLISGPTLMALADHAAYVQVLAHIGEVPMAVTTSLTMHFLRGAQPGELIAEAHLLRLGRRIATSDVRLWTEGPDRIAAQATVAYAIPSAT
jgi:uncharacterized protein (TIGR00369 family)